MKKTSLGEIRTMADDLLAAEGKQPVLEVEENKAEPKNDEPAKTDAGPSSVNQNKAKTPHDDLKKLLPFDDEDQENTNTASNSNIEPPAPQKAPEPPKPKTSEPDSLQNIPKIDSSDLEKEIFPGPNSTPPKKNEGIDIPAPPKPNKKAPESPKKDVLESGPPKPPEEKPKKKSPGPRKNKKFLLLGVLGLVGAIIVGAIIYILISGSDPENSIIDDTPPDNQNGEQVISTPPNPLFTPDLIQEVSVANERRATLIRTLDILSEQDQGPSPGSITYIPIRLKDVVVDGNKAKYLNAEEFLGGLGISTPENFFDSVDPEFTLYMYQATEEERVLCQNNLVTENSCFGPRLGVVFKHKGENSTPVDQLVEEWKAMTPESNLEVLALNSLAVVPSDTTYSTESYEGIDISYINLPMPSYNNLRLSATSIDMATIGEYILISTSKNSTLSAIDRIIEELY